MANGKAGAPKGNNNARKETRQWSEVVRRIALRDKKRLEKLAEALMKKCEEGDISAFREFGDRFEGKVPQAIEGTGEDGSFTIVVSSRDKNVL